MAPRHHTLDIYGAEIHLATNRRDWATLRRQDPDLDPADSLGATAFGVKHYIPNLYLFIHVADHKAPADLLNTCAHEATHAATALLEHVGTPLSGGSEALAYLVGWLTRWLWEGCS